MEDVCESEEEEGGGSDGGDGCGCDDDDDDDDDGGGWLERSRSISSTARLIGRSSNTSLVRDEGALTSPNACFVLKRVGLRSIGQMI